MRFVSIRENFRLQQCFFENLTKNRKTYQLGVNQLYYLNNIFSVLHIWLQCRSYYATSALVEVDNLFSINRNFIIFNSANRPTTAKQVNFFFQKTFYRLYYFRTKLPFMVPFVPILPITAITANIFLMCRLSVITWVRFIIWCIVGK